MKLLIILSLFITNLWAQDINSLLLQKTKNYEYVIMQYSNLLEIESDANFCNSVVSLYDVLLKIYDQDYALMRSLAQNGQVEYAKHLDENKLSDLFLINGIKQNCYNTIRFSDSISRSIINTRYLKMYHDQFVELYNSK